MKKEGRGLDLTKMSTVSTEKRKNTKQKSTEKRTETIMRKTDIEKRTNKKIKETSIEVVVMRAEIDKRTETSIASTRRVRTANERDRILMIVGVVKVVKKD